MTLQIKLFVIALFLSIGIGQAQLIALIQNSEAPGEVTQGIETLYDFEVLDAQPSRIYFKSTGDVSGLTTTGYVVSFNTISSVTVNGTGTTGHYFTVGTPFTFWDNNTIHLTAQNNNVYAFSLDYIDNKINEPTAATNRYVEVGGSGDGTTIGNPASLSYAMANAVAGQTWHIKAGNYGDVVFNPVNSGTVSSPIKFIGYKTTPGDITTNYYDGTNTFLTTEMPTVSNGSRATDTYQVRIDTDYIVIKNFQATNSDSGFIFRNATGVHGERLNSLDMGDAYDVGFGIYTPWTDANQNAHTNSRNRIVDCVSKNATGNNIGVVGGGVLVENCVSRCNENGGDLPTDYYIVFRGSHNISKDNLVVRELDNGHTGYHGFKSENETLEAGYKTTTTNVPTEYCLMQGCTMVDIGRPLKARNSGTNYCVFKDNIVDNTLFSSSNGGEETFGISIWGGVKGNLWERNFMRNVYSFVVFRKNTEDMDYDLNRISENNIVRNNIGLNSRMYFMIISASGDNQNMEVRNNKIYNNTFHGYYSTSYSAGGLVWAVNADVATWNFSGGNDIVGNIITESPALNYSGSGWTGTDDFNWNYNNFFDAQAGATPTGTGNFAVNPSFVNEGADDFQPTATFTSIDVPWQTNVYYDYEKGLRNTTATTVGAIKHADEVGTNPGGGGLTSVYDGADAADAINESNSVSATWTFSGATLSSNATEYYDGSYSIEIMSNSGVWERGNYYFPTTAGVTYDVSFYAKQSTSTSPWRIYIRNFDDTSYLYNDALNRTGYDTWTEVTFSFTADGNQSQFRLYSTINDAANSAGDKVWVDRIVINPQ